MVRFKNRYLLVSFIFPESQPNFLNLESDWETADDPRKMLSEGSIIKLLRESLLANFGELGAGAVGGLFTIKYLSPNTGMMILRVSREHCSTLRSAITLLRRVANRPVICRILSVSGTIRKVQHSAIAYDRKVILMEVSALERYSKQQETTRKQTNELEEQLQRNEAEIMALEA